MANNYIWVLLLIAPGFACHTIYAHLNQRCQNDDGLRLMLSSLNYSIWILALNYLVLYWRGLRTFNDIQLRLNYMDFILKYIGLSMVSCYIIAFLLTLIYPHITVKISNAVRYVLKKPLITTVSPWERLFDNQGEAYNFEVDERIKVFIQHGSVPVANGRVLQASRLNNKKELLLQPDEKMEDGLHNQKTRYTYVDCENFLVIKVVE